MSTESWQADAAAFDSRSGVLYDELRFITMLGSWSAGKTIPVKTRMRVECALGTIYVPFVHPL
jgi:hypothetical protein